MRTPRANLGRLARIGTMLLGLSALASTHASTFGIAPVRVDLAEAQSTEAVTIRNESDAAVVLQARVMNWAQDDGVDSFADTRDVIVTPPVLTIAAQSVQIVRVALRRPADESSELSYRLFLQEVPQAVPRTERGLMVALRLSLPIFVAPASSAASAQVDWISRWHDDGSLAIEAHNRGTAHLQLASVHVEFGDGGPGIDVGPVRYLLPGTRAHWSVQPPPGVDRSAPISVHGRTDAGEFSAGVIAPSL